jgi:hypothetical protein
MPATDVVTRYLNLTRARKLLFWQSLSHDITISLRYALNRGEKSPAADAAVKEGVQALHMAVGYSMALLNGTADESSIGQLIEGIGGNRLLPPQAVERALGIAASSGASLDSLQPAAE